MEQRRVGASYLRKLTAESLAALGEVLIITVDGQDVVAIVPWGYYQNGFIEAHGERSEVPPELEAHVRETLERVKALPELNEIGTLLGHLIEPLKGLRGVGITNEPGPRPSLPAPNATCRHCGERWFSPTKFATICSECKSTGHTNEPGECPRCTEGEQI